MRLQVVELLLRYKLLGLLEVIGLSLVEFSAWYGFLAQSAKDKNKLIIFLRELLAFLCDPWRQREARVALEEDWAAYLRPKLWIVSHQPVPYQFGYHAPQAPDVRPLIVIFVSNNYFWRPIITCAKVL